MSHVLVGQSAVTTVQHVTMLELAALPNQRLLTGLARMQSRRFWAGFPILDRLVRNHS